VGSIQSAKDWEKKKPEGTLLLLLDIRTPSSPAFALWDLKQNL
jgi:hypothetical protein